MQPCSSVALAVGLTFQPPIERMTLSRGFWALKPTIVGMNSLSFASTLLFTLQRSAVRVGKSHSQCCNSHELELVIGSAVPPCQPTERGQTHARFVTLFMAVETRLLVTHRVALPSKV